MKNNTKVFYSIAAFLILVSASVALAKEAESGGSGGRGTDDITTQLSASTSAQSRNNLKNDDGTPDQGKGDFNINGTSTIRSGSDDGTEDQRRGEGEEHRSRVASVVNSLLSIADKDNEIGDDIRFVANEQASTSEKVKRDMDEINGESSLKRFFFGTNFKNTGELRSTIVTTQNHIDKLKKAEDRTTNTSVKADLSAQIIELQKVASSTQGFIDDNENKFSLLGWFVRLFSR